MNQLRKVVGIGAGLFAMLVLMMGLNGCSTPAFDDDAVKGIAPKGSTNSVVIRPIDVFRVGDTVLITFSGMEPKIEPHQEIIKDDGTISPPEINKSVVAAGKTPAELQNELLKAYQKIYVHPSVTVQPAARFYYILGDVIRPGPQQYLAETDMIKAIAAAGGLTEFARKGDIQLRRAGSRKVYHIDYKQALLGNPKHDLPVFPGDTIFVPRSPI